MTGFKLKIGLFVALFLCCAQTWAQQVDLNRYSDRHIQKFAESAARNGDVYSAIYYYEHYYQRNKDNSQVNYQLAKLYKESRNYEAARDLFMRLTINNREKYPLSQFYYGQMLKSLGQYEEAIEEFTSFRKLYKGEKNDKLYRRLAGYEIEGCESAQQLRETPLDISIDNLSSQVNGPHVDFSPVQLNDSTLLYAALDIDSMLFLSNDETDMLNKPVRQFYLAKRNDLDWNGKIYWESNINMPNVETGNGVFSPERNRFYFNRCEKNWLNNNICAIYVSEKKDGTWQEPKALPASINDPKYTSTQPAVGYDTKYNREIIYFVSDRPDGRGGLDIFYTVYDPGKDMYSSVKNLGSKINTPGDEMTPYYDQFKSMLYFSSNGWPGLGGFDVFSSLGERSKWTTPQNMGYPLNTSYDDLYYTVGIEQVDGFFASNRPGGQSFENQTCCDDIYYYKWKDYIRLFVTGKVYPIEKDRFGRKRDFSGFDFMNPDESIKPLENAVIAMYLIDDENNDLILIGRDSTDADGSYLFNVLPDKNYEFKMEGFQYFEDKAFLSTEFINFSDTIELPPTWVNILSDAPIVLENIYYEFNKAELKPEAMAAIDTTLLVLLKEAPEFIIEIGSHTDSVGGEKFNLKLSQERAQYVVEYLISKGIPRDRLVAKGYGSGKPVAPNTNPDGTDNPEGRLKNRRTEFRVVGSTIEEEDEDEFIEDD